MARYDQVEERIMLNVAGGLMLEHPLTLPFVDTVVSFSTLPAHAMHTHVHKNKKKKKEKKRRNEIVICF